MKRLRLSCICRACHGLPGAYLVSLYILFFVPVGVHSLPAICVAAHIRQLVLSLPAQDLLCLGGIGVAGGDVTGTAVYDLVGNGSARGRLKGIDDIQHRVAVARADVEILHLGHGAGSLQSAEVSLGQIHHVDVVADTRAVGGIVVVAEDVEEGTAARSHLGDVGEQVIGDALGILTHETRLVGAHGVEVAQDAHRPVGGGLVDVGQNALDHLLGLAVGVGGDAEGGGLLDRDLGGVAVDGGRGGEDDDLHAVLLHSLAEVEGGDEIIEVVGSGNGHRLTHGLQACEVDDALDIGVLGEHAVKSLGVAEVGLVELGAHTRDGGDTVQHDLLAVAEIVYDDGGLTRLDQLDDGMGAYEAGSAGDKNRHKGFSLITYLWVQWIRDIRYKIFLDRPSLLGGFLYLSRAVGLAKPLHKLLQLFHIRLGLGHQLELGTGANKVVIGIVGMEVNVAVQVIRQEADTRLKGQHITAQREHGYLLFGQRAATALDKAAGVDLEHLGKEMHLIEIGLVLGGGGCAGADGVAEVVEAGAGHDGIQVNDANGLLGDLVQEDVGELGIVVGHAEGKRAVSQRVHNEAALLCAVGDELDLILHQMGSARGVPLQRGQEVGVAALGIVEVGNGFDQHRGIEIRQSALEVAEGLAHAAEGLGAVQHEAADGALHEVIGAPEAALLVGIAVCAVGGEDDVQRAALGILAGLRQTLADMVSDGDNVVHNPDGILEYGGVEDLKDVALAPLHGNDVGRVDVAVTADPHVGDVTVEGKAGTDGQHLLMSRLSHDINPTGARDTLPRR